jgi:putative component of membrane protein insertase Oxa1/YidC/SpoIIIJ protein YidD
MLSLSRIIHFPMMWSVLITIRLYQRWLSPLKGYSCAYRVHAGGQSCSGYGYVVVRRFGAPMGIKLLRRRMTKCADIFDRHCQPKRSDLHAQANFQSGHCDVSVDGCDGCDMSDLVQGTGDILSNCTPDSSGCGSTKQKKSKKLKYKPLPKSL